MSPERFKTLADTYGGSIARWPATERKGARALLLARPEASAILADQAALDDALARWTLPGPGAAIAARIAATAAHQRVRARRFVLWFSSLGAAAALASGVATGVAIVSMSVPSADRTGGHWYELSVLGTPLDLPEPPVSNGPS